MKIIFFIGSSIANLLIIYLSENNSIKNNLLSYAISSAIVSLVLTILYAGTNNKNKIKITNSIIGIVGISSLYIYSDSYYLWMSYASCVLASEFASSQVLKNRAEQISRLFVMILPLLFLFNIKSEYVMQTRIIIGLITIAYAEISGKNEYNKLAINKPIIYFILVYIAYTGSQLLYTLILDSVGLKIWFIANQLGVGIYLKIIDFKTRDYGVVLPLQNIVLFFVVLVGLVAVYITKIYFPMLIYSVAIIFVMLANSLVVKERKIQ